jgi:site-specific DNA-methyltransferase (adenine-specific)
MGVRRLVPFYADEAVTLYHGDMRGLVPLLVADGLRADAIVTDPPYEETSLAWDQWVYGWPALVAQAASSMWCFGSMRMFLTHHDEFDPWKLSHDVVWEKHNGSGAATDRFRRVHEHALHWYRGPWADVHHDTPTTPDAVARRVHARFKPAHWRHLDPNVYVSADGGPRLMRSVIPVRSMHHEATTETEKPVGILRPLIEYACPAGGLVLDPFAGSGSTGDAARLAGRRAVLVEAREQCCEQIAARLSQGVLPVPVVGEELLW